jgi:hypothetical protein
LFAVIVHHLMGGLRFYNSEAGQGVAQYAWLGHALLLFAGGLLAGDRYRQRGGDRFFLALTIMTIAVVSTILLLCQVQDWRWEFMLLPLGLANWVYGLEREILTPLRLQHSWLPSCLFQALLVQVLAGNYFLRGPRWPLFAIFWVGCLGGRYAMFILSGDSYLPFSSVLGRFDLFWLAFLLGAEGGRASRTEAGWMIVGVAVSLVAWPYWRFDQLRSVQGAVWGLGLLDFAIAGIFIALNRLPRPKAVEGWSIRIYLPILVAYLVHLPIAFWSLRLVGRSYPAARIFSAASLTFCISLALGILALLAFLAARDRVPKHQTP